MPAGEIRFRREAEADLAEAFDWYESQTPGLGVEFLKSVESALDVIVSNPRLYHEVVQNARRAIMRRFPFAITYLPVGRSIIVLAVLHQARDPECGRGRVS